MSRRERRADRKAAAEARQAELHEALDEPIRAIGDWARHSGDHRVMRYDLMHALHGAAEAAEIPPSAPERPRCVPVGRPPPADRGGAMMTVEPGDAILELPSGRAWGLIREVEPRRLRVQRYVDGVLMEPNRKKSNGALVWVDIYPNGSVASPGCSLRVRHLGTVSVSHCPTCGVSMSAGEP